MKWIAITGANGFIGHNLVLEFLEKRSQTLELGIDRVLGADLQASLERPTHQRALQHQDYHFCLADDMVARLDEYEKKWGCPPLAVVHNGACSSTTETDPEIFRTLNVEASQKLFGYCSKRSVPLLYASSASVYGDGSAGFSDALDANADYSPLNLYGESKHRFDSWVLEQPETPPFWYGLRYFNVFGPYEEHKGAQASLLHWGRDQIESTGVLKLFKSHRNDIGDGQQRRDFVSVFDIIRVSVALLIRSQRPDLRSEGLFVNIGRGQAATWIEAGTALFAALKREPKIEFINMPLALRQHYQNYTCADLSTLKRLGLADPILSLEEGFSRSRVSMSSSF